MTAFRFLVIGCFVASSCMMGRANAMSLFSSKSSTTRYFTHEGILPPLPLSTLPSNSTTIPYSVVSEYSSNVPVTYTNNPKTVYQWLTKNLPHEGCVLGVDVESVPPGMYRSGSKRNQTPRRNPFERAATVQLATTDACLVVHLVRNSGEFSYACAPILKAILEDERYIKAGCALDGDFISLHRIWGSLEVASRLDLGLIGIQPHRRNNDRGPRTRHGLQSLCRSLLDVHLPKPKQVAMSDWSHVPLTEDQIMYSARDAWAGAAIAQKLVEYDPETFDPKNLMHILPKREPSIDQLVQRQRRRDRAKRDLQDLLKPYQSKPFLPKPVRDRAQSLRGVIRERIIDSQLVFKTDHLDFDLVRQNVLNEWC